jgi:hypothetical protein
VGNDGNISQIFSFQGSVSPSFSDFAVGSLVQTIYYSTFFVFLEEENVIKLKK